MWETSCRVVPSAGLFSKEVQDHLTSRGRWEELCTRPRMTRVSRDLAEMISTVWIRPEYAISIRICPWEDCPNSPMSVREVPWKRAGPREELNLSLMHLGQFPSRSM